MEAQLLRYRSELEMELQSLLQYWTVRTKDTNFGGFVGQIDWDDKVIPAAPKGVVLNARILWSFSAAYVHTQDPAHLEQANRAFHYLMDHFLDPVYGGVYWTVDHAGKPLDRKKQVYAISFVIYAFAEYYRVNADRAVIDSARRLYELLLTHAYDKEYGGYIEALTEDWQPLEDQRLSEKDTNTPKSMNTMLHVVEGFTNLYRIWPDAGLRRQIAELLADFEQHIIHRTSHHLDLFFEQDWIVRGDEISFGHDIEASWLLLEAATVIGDEALIGRMKEQAVSMARAAAKGLDADGGLWYEADRHYRKWVHEKHWWPQAEGMVGFLNAFELTGDPVYWQQSIGCWDFVKASLRSPTGEWHWGITRQGLLIQKDKAGLWKCPYHNSRACLEVISRIDRLLAVHKSPDNSKKQTVS